MDISTSKSRMTWAPRVVMEVVDTAAMAMVDTRLDILAMVTRLTAVVEASETVVVAAAARTATVEAVVLDMAAAVMVVVAVVDIAAAVTVVFVDVDRQSILQECWVLVHRLNQI
ncbi:hypothetical protein DPMN_060418 [Dreissena polymorpha]|uniref:Uncharacterized protein n=1 Tax=Dreissena polymorpha TaxID=45954 RepID=A0A9D4C5J8_DREPO|nr:hypothetical protein DPMN_060418 [Dreissena polymorpha]